MLVVLGAAWTGVAALRKSTKASGSKVMFVGCTLATVGLLLAIVFGVISMSGSLGSSGFFMVAQILNLLIPLGFVVFIVGFALHGLQVRGIVERMAELEAIVNAQQEHLSRLETQA